MRQFELYVRNKRHFEVVPVGFSWGALLLGIFWAPVYGLLFRYLGIIAISAIPLAFALLLGYTVFDIFGQIGIAATNAGHIYFSFKAFEWRESALTSKGFVSVASIAANSAQHALETWSKSDDAAKFLSSAV